MPEGPTIVILKEAAQSMSSKKILEAHGNAAIDMSRLKGQRVTAFKSWGKHFLICLPKLTLRVHFLMFGSYSIGEQTKPESRLRLALVFPKNALYLYTCSIKEIGDPDEVYDWTADVLNEHWDPGKARRKLKAMPDTMVCDALLDQTVFAGVGNIIKNEVLFRIRLHPETLVGNLPPRKLSELIREARQYSFDFLAWKKAFELKQHWLVYNKKICPRCHIPVIKVKAQGNTKRRAFFCGNCQLDYQ